MPLIQKQIRAVTASWRSQSPSIRVIRLWLGVTWIYGGWDKATDPDFLGKIGATSISKQLAGYSKSSPLGFLFQHLIERATLVGVVVMLAEFAIGIATIFWIAPTFTAFSGFAMSLGLWLAATWHVKPYFLGSDTAYAILWLAYLLALIGKRRRVELSLDRRGAMRVGGLGIAAGLAIILGRGFAKTPIKANSTGTAKQILKVADLPIGKTHEFVTPSGEPAVLFRTKSGVFAYSEICTHQGCTVAYSSTDKTLVCPCHQAVYDPFKDAQVLSGPAPAPLSKIAVAIEGSWIVLA
jgi:thiosulfate dehydrogenase [quinone] large subunit